MIGQGGRCSLWRAARGGLGALLALVAVGCGGGPDAVATPGAGPAATAPAAVLAPDVFSVDEGAVVGIISIGDLVEAIIRDQQEEIEHLEHYISG